MKRYEEIIEYFGFRNQMKKLNEECFEFLEAVNIYEDDKMYNGKGEDIFRDHIVEEMGDMLLLLTEFIAKYEISSVELNKVMDYKLERTEKRIKEGYYDKKVID